ncbi:YlxR family protein [Paenibacillus thermoaerophilus]|nr:YlxR family protein [Paenibacillus thermoaerophilus]TMV13886.1 YlxR family protein [Paenibacillus thermoaerophilus]
MRVRKIPQRKCVTCQKMLSKKEMVRVVRTPEGTVELDPTGKKNGRGAYLCGRWEGFQQAKKTRVLERALKQPITPEMYEQLESQFAQIRAKYEEVPCEKFGDA